jgi:hypothetical protein
MQLSNFELVMDVFFMCDVFTRWLERWAGDALLS